MSVWSLVSWNWLHLYLHISVNCCTKCFWCTSDVKWCNIKNDNDQSFVQAVVGSAGVGVMASLYGSKVTEGGMTLELSLEINKKLQASPLFQYPTKSMLPLIHTCPISRQYWKIHCWRTSPWRTTWVPWVRRWARWPWRGTRRKRVTRTSTRRMENRGGLASWLW